MSTPTNERSETCERDEDLEKLIGDCFMSRCFASENGCDVIDYENFVNACNAVAAFSARRAREKAIEECIYEADKIGNVFSKDFNDGVERVLRELKKLKSQPQ